MQLSQYISLMKKIYPIKLTHPLVLKVSMKRYAANTNVLEHSYDS